MSDETERQALLNDVSQIEGMSDGDLMERHGELARIERAQFLETLSPRSFIGTAAYLMNPPLDHARRAVEKELRRRHIWQQEDARDS